MLSTMLPEMLYTELFSTSQEENIIPEVASHRMMSGDNIYSFGTSVFLQMAAAIDGKKIYWCSIKLHAHLRHNSSHLLHKNIFKFQMSPGNRRLWTSGKVWINFAEPNAEFQIQC